MTATPIRADVTTEVVWGSSDASEVTVTEVVPENPNMFFEESFESCIDGFLSGWNARVDNGTITASVGENMMDNVKMPILRTARAG